MAETHSKRGRIFAALVLIGFGLLFLLGNLGAFHIGHVFGTYWPVILIAIGISRLMSSGKRDTGGAVFFIGLGLLFLVNNLHFLHGSMIDYWPLILILVGVWILFKPRGGNGKYASHAGWKHTSETVKDENDRLEVVTIFGGQERPVQSENFSGGEVTIIFGGSKLDLRQAKSTLKDIHIEITAIFSGLDIIVPPQWSLEVNITPMFGSVEDKRRNMLQETVGEAPRLHLHGSSIFSGIEITS